MSKNKKRPSADDSENDLVKQITEEMLPGPVLSPNDPAAALAAIDAWNDEWLAIVESQTPKKYALSKVLEEFIERTNYLARWCESLGLDSSPLVQFAHDARQTYFAMQPMLPSVPSGLWLLLDRRKFKLPSLRQIGQPQIGNRFQMMKQTSRSEGFLNRIQGRQHGKSPLGLALHLGEYPTLMLGWLR